MIVQLNIGFLFDVDGTLTYYRGNDSKIDLLIINDLELIRKKNYPIGFVTGRSVDWVKDIYFTNITPDLREYIQISAEFGLVNWYQGKKSKSRISKNVKLALNEAKDRMINTICENKELEPCISFTEPDHRCLWIEPKEIMVTLRTLPSYQLTSESYVKIISEIIDDYKEELKLELNPYAVDILPKTASKKIAAKKSIKKLDPENSIEKWFAVGDSEADKEMAEAFKKKIQFHLVPRGDTSATHILLDNILRGKY